MSEREGDDPLATVSNRRGLVIGMVLAVLVGISLLTRQFAPILRDPTALSEWFAGFGVFAPVAFVLVQIIQVIVAPIPGHVMGFASGYLFGGFYGTLYSVAGSTIGSALAVLLARRFGRPFVKSIVPVGTMDRFDDAVDEGGLIAVFLVFLIPGLPDDTVCFLAGLTTIPIWQLVIIAAVGRFPGLLLANLAGAGLAASQPLRALVIVSVLVAFSLSGYWKRDHLAQWIQAHK